MAHPDHGDLLALLDGELDGSETQQVRAHLAECSSCTEEMRLLEAASVRLEQALKLMDGPVPSPEELRARLAAGPGRRPLPAPRESRDRARDPRRSLQRKPRFLRRMTVPWAASIALLLTAAAVSAFPGSPVRQWIQDGWTALTRSSAPASGPSVETLTGEGQGETPGSAPEGGEAGAGIPVTTGATEIGIHGLSPDASLTVQWVEDDEAWIYAGQGTRFSSVAGRLEAFDPPGDVRVVIPRSALDVILTVDGTLLLRKAGTDLQILGPVQERTPSEIRFESSGTPNASSRPGVR